MVEKVEGGSGCNTNRMGGASSSSGRIGDGGIEGWVV